MTPTPRTSIENSDRLARLEEKLDFVIQRLSEIDQMVKQDYRAQAEAIQAIQQNCARQSGAAVENYKKVAKHEKRIETLEVEMAKIVAPVRLMIWVGAVFGLSVIALIWSLLTGVAQYGFR